MDISSPLHQDIFYPNSKDRIEEMLKDCKLDKHIDNFSAIFVPHASYSYILDLLKKGLSELNNQNILIIAPPHMPILQKDKSYNLFVPKSQGWQTPYGDILFNEEIINEFAKDEMKCNDYFEEESEFELLYPLIKKYSPNSKIVPICAEITNSKQSKDLATILNRIYSKFDNIMIIVSGNLNKYEQPKFALKEALEFRELLEKGEFLLQPFAKKRISSCACGILDSIRKTKELKDKQWKLTDFEAEGVLSKDIEEIKTTNKIVYHSLGFLK